MFYCNTPNLGLNPITLLLSYMWQYLYCGRRLYHISGHISLKKKQFFELSIIQSVSPWQMRAAFEFENSRSRSCRGRSVALSFVNNISSTTG